MDYHRGGVATLHLGVRGLPRACLGKRQVERQFLTYIKISASRGMPKNQNFTRENHNHVENAGILGFPDWETPIDGSPKPIVPR